MKEWTIRFVAGEMRFFCEDAFHDQTKQGDMKYISGFHICHFNTIWLKNTCCIGSDGFERLLSSVSVHRRRS
jgi:hypothetical protein